MTNEGPEYGNFTQVDVGGRLATRHDLARAGVSEWDSSWTAKDKLDAASNPPPIFIPDRYFAPDGKSKAPANWRTRGSVLITLAVLGVFGWLGFNAKVYLIPTQLRNSLIVATIVWLVAIGIWLAVYWLCTPSKRER